MRVSIYFSQNFFAMLEQLAQVLIIEVSYPATLEQWAQVFNFHVSLPHSVK